MDFQLNLDAETVDRAYPREPVCVEPTTTVREVLVLMKERRVGSVLVCDSSQDGRLVGIFTERDALYLMANGFRAAAEYTPPEGGAEGGVAVAGTAGRQSSATEAAAGSVLEQPVEQVMTADPVTLSRTDTVGKAITMMSSGGYRRLPTTDESGKPLGTLETAGILRYLAEHFPKVIYTLPPAPHHAQQTREGA